MCPFYRTPASTPVIPSASETDDDCDYDDTLLESATGRVHALYVLSAPSCRGETRLLTRSRSHTRLVDATTSTAGQLSSATARLRRRQHTETQQTTRENVRCAPLCTDERAAQRRRSRETRWRRAATTRGEGRIDDDDDVLQNERAIPDPTRTRSARHTRENCRAAPRRARPCPRFAPHFTRHHRHARRAAVAAADSIIYRDPALLCPRAPSGPSVTWVAVGAPRDPTSFATGNSREIQVATRA